MRSVLVSILKWIGCEFLPVYIGFFLLVSLFMWVTSGFESVRELWPVIALMTFPAAGLVGAQQSIR